MAAADQRTIDSGTPVEVLMERAGRAVARTAIRMLEGRYGKKVVVVCGKGNNAGDGYAAARVLRQEGVATRCLAVVDPAELKGPARHHFELAARAGVLINRFDRERLSVDLVIDAILGTGFKGAVDVAEPVGKAITAVVDHTSMGSTLVLSVDVPSGMNATTGSAEGPAVVADVTVAMGAEKLGSFLAPEYSGEVEVVDIGIGPPDAQVSAIDRGFVSPALPPRAEDAHKRSSGSVAILAGSDEMPGAAVLVARAALRAGCGYVALGCTDAVARIVRSVCPEVLVHVVSDGPHLGPGAIERFGSVLERSSAVVAGPGLGTGSDQEELIVRLVEATTKPLLLDADALNVFEGEIERLESAHDLTITPHPMELARLLGSDVAKIQDDRIEAARDASRRSGGVVLLKGRRSVISGVEEPTTLLNPTGGPELATAGTGDVLAGIGGAFLAHGSSSTSVKVAAAAYIHGLAGSIAAETFGHSGVVAWDVAEALPEAIDMVRER